MKYKLRKSLSYTASKYIILSLFISFSLNFTAVYALNLSQGKFKYTQAQYIMGTLFRIELYSENQLKADIAFKAAFKELRKYDLIMSNYRTDSELSRIGKIAASYPTPVSPEFFNIIRESLNFSELTDGYFDITVGPLVKLWGFKNNLPKGDPDSVYRIKNFKKPSSEQIEKMKEKVGYRNIYLNPYNQTVFFNRGDIEIDFGAIGKGYAIDQAVKVIRDEGINSGVIDAVSNQYYIGSPPDTDFWKVGIKDPRNENKIIKYIYLKDTSVSTSGDYEQFFLDKNVRYTHIINPLTGYPIKNSVASTVVFKNAAYADALSTSLLLLDEAQSKALIKRFKNIYAFKLTYNSTKRAPYSDYRKDKFKFFEYWN